VYGVVCTVCSVRVHGHSVAVPHLRSNVYERNAGFWLSGAPAGVRYDTTVGAPVVVLVCSLMPSEWSWPWKKP
jgi:hypothetical protein